MVDIHTHILFGVDDGAKSLDDSLSLLKEAKKQGIDTVFATPHFYTFNTDFDSYKLKVDENFKVLSKLINNDEYPNLKLGYEVRYFKGMHKSEELKNFTLDNSEYILIELEFTEITDDVINDLEEIRWQLGLKPIIAHIERYYKFKGYKKILSLIDHQNFYAQVTAAAVVGKDKYCKITNKLIKNNNIDFIASDAHNLNSRTFYMYDALQTVNKKFNPNIAKTFIGNSYKISNSR